MDIRFRPHHFLCTFCFQGSGYSQPFVDNYHQISTQLKNNPQSAITVVEQTDSICAPCPHRRDLLCSSETKVQDLDRAHGAALDIKIGDILSWEAAQARIIERINFTKFNTICANCEWKALGICEKIITAAQFT